MKSIKHNANSDKEKQYITDMLTKYNPKNRRIFDNTDGIECIYLGEGIIPSELTQSVSKAKLVIKSIFGEKINKVFKGLKIYYVRGEPQGGGWTYSGANAITMDIDNNCLTISVVEKLLGPKGAKILEYGDWEKVVEGRDPSLVISGETTFIHEIGHILQAKTKTKFADTENAPTKYGKSKEWEDYAESFLYYCYNKPLKGNRKSLIAQDIERVMNNL